MKWLCSIVIGAGAVLGMAFTQEICSIRMIHGLRKNSNLVKNLLE